MVSSPPYEASLIGTGRGIDWSKTARNGDVSHWPSLQGGSYLTAAPSGYTRTEKSENIGNLKGEKYWDSMKQVYAECHRVLKPGGVMVLVLKGFTRDGVYQDLPQMTTECLESHGWELFDSWKRELWTLSFWRILQRRRDPDGFDERLRFEEVLAFRKKGDT